MKKLALTLMCGLLLAGSASAQLLDDFEAYGGIPNANWVMTAGSGADVWIDADSGPSAPGSQALYFNSVGWQSTARSGLSLNSVVQFDIDPGPMGLGGVLVLKLFQGATQICQFQQGNGPMDFIGGPQIPGTTSNFGWKTVQIELNTGANTLRARADEFGAGYGAWTAWFGYQNPAVGNLDTIELGSWVARGNFDNIFIPEPATMVLLSVGGLFGLLRRRRS